MRISFFLSLFILFTFACGDEETTISDSQIVGTWQAVSGVQQGRTETNSAAGNIAVEFTSTLDNPEDYFVEFSADPNRVTPIGSPSITVEYTIDGMQTTTGAPITQPLQSGEYTISGNTITFGPAGGPTQDATIVTLTETDLTLSGEYNLDQSIAGATISQRSEWTYVFKRSN
jgi:hypothetical protein